LRVGIGRSVASLAALTDVEEDSKNWSVDDLVGLLETTCEEVRPCPDSLVVAIGRTVESSWDVA
jgi:hypothetical protein